MQADFEARENRGGPGEAVDLTWLGHPNILTYAVDTDATKSTRRGQSNSREFKFESRIGRGDRQAIELEPARMMVPPILF